MTRLVFYDLILSGNLQLKGGGLLTYNRVVTLLNKEEEVSGRALANALEMVTLASLSGQNPQVIVSFLEEAKIHGENVSLFWEMCDRDPKKVSACIAITEIYGKKDYSKEAMKKHVIEKNKPFFDKFFKRTKGRLL